MDTYRGQLQFGIAEMEATIEELRAEIQQLIEQRNALQAGNLELYRELTKPKEPEF